MKLTQLILPFAAWLAFATCKGAENNTDHGNTDTDKLPPVETQAPNTNYKPAFEGQTRAPGVKTETPYDVVPIAEGLSKPWGMAVMPDGRLLITEKTGTMRIATPEGQLSDKITGIPTVNSNGQGGLQGVTLAPDFSSSRMVYFIFSEQTPAGNVAAAAKGRLSNDEKTLENVQVFYRANPAWDSQLHYGGRILFDKQGNLFICTGERSVLSSRPKAQLLDNALGKVLHITTEGKAVAGGPFSETPGALPEIYSYGHRNPLGLAFHPATGDLWMAEMGPRGGDEINLIKPGKNYGWPTITYGIEYGGATIGEGITQKEGMEQPVYYWDPVLSPGGMAFYGSKVIPEWENNAFVAGLSSKHIARLVIKDNKVVGEERLLVNEGQRIREVIENKGVLYAITDEGRLYKISKK